MTYTEVKRLIYEITARYFSSAIVDMANTKRTKKGKPLVTLRFGNAKMSKFPVEKNLDGELCRCYPSGMKLEVQLFTNGARLPNGAMENTAVGDLIDYMNYMASEMVTQELDAKRVSILPAGDVQDVTAIINDTSYEYRAMVEFDISYTTISVGFAGVHDEASIKIDQPDPENPGQVLPPHIEPEWTPTSSGGRNAEIAEKTTGYFTEVEITEM